MGWHNVGYIWVDCYGGDIRIYWVWGDNEKGLQQTPLELDATEAAR
jgi:hypothetical protein